LLFFLGDTANNIAVTMSISIHIDLSRYMGKIGLNKNAVKENMIAQWA
jgi:hypothetical protein